MTRASFVNCSTGSVCVTPHAGTGVALFTAPRVGAAGRQGNTVGVYMCADLACSLYARGRKETEAGTRFESLTAEERVARAVANLDAFLGRVLDDTLANA
ncbi:FBP domain-containing protein [Nonomuraea wenchangensis]|uniref:FBP domain-containing protein n=1 Tax=Nonomuraea wenchangensis TaxID=568860 RepID=UPI003435F257